MNANEKLKISLSEFTTVNLLLYIIIYKDQ